MTLTDLRVPRGGGVGDGEFSGMRFTKDKTTINTEDRVRKRTHRSWDADRVLIAAVNRAAHLNLQGHLRADPRVGRGRYTDKDIKHLQNTAHIRHGPACTSATPAPRACTTSSTSWSTTAWTRRWPGYCKHISVDDQRGRLVLASPTTAAASPSTSTPTIGRSDARSRADHRRRRRQVRQRRRTRSPPACTASGAKAVTALSEWTEARSAATAGSTCRSTSAARRPPRSRTSAQPRRARPAPRSRSSPTREIFHDVTFDYDTLENRLRELAFLNKGLAIKLIDERTGKKETFHVRGRHRRVRRVPQPQRRDVLHAADLRRQDGRRRPRRGGVPVHRPARRSAAGATPTTPTTPAAARTCPASAPPSPARSTPTATRRSCSRTTCSRSARTSARA